jgi:signal transduction histidine kinase/ligand-binding sensor domain-containing protein
MAASLWMCGSRAGAGGLLVALLGAAPLFALDPQRAPNRYGHAVWLARDGLAQDFVQAIAQTADGYLWVGTLGGLVRFDGVRFTVFDSSTTPGLRDVRITALAPARDGALWIGTAAGGLARLERGVITPYEPASERGDRSLRYVRSLYEAEDGSLWVGTSGGGLRRFRSGRRLRAEEPAAPGHTISAIRQDRRGRLWIGTTEGVGVVEGGRLSTHLVPPSLPGDFVQAIAEDRKGAVWIGTRGGLARFEDGRITALGPAAGLPPAVVRAIHEDRQGNLWVGTAGQGLFRVSGGKVARFAAGDGLSNDNVTCLFEDQEGNLWVGTQRGLNRLKDVPFTSYTARDGLSHEQVNSVLGTRDGSIWIGTDGGGLHRLRDGRLRVFTARDGLGSGYIGPLFESREGSLWVGGDGYISRVDGDRIVTYRTDAAGEGNFVSVLVEDARGNLVVANADKPLMRFAAGRLRPYEPATAGRHYRFSALRDRDGALWFATVEGLAHFKDGRYTLFTEKDGLPDDTVHSVHQDAEGTLWIATVGGLCRFRDGRFASFAGRGGLGGGVVSQVLEDDAGFLWMSGRHGIVRVRKVDLDAHADGRASSVPFTTYGPGDGLESADYNPSYIHPAACRTADGRLWFATTKGIAVIDPQRLQVDRRPPPVALEDALADDRLLPRAPGVRVPAGTKSFEFHYTALSLAAPEKVRFRYRLEGFDRDWTAPHDRRTAYYTNLPPGPYRFRVQAANPDGVWNEEGASLTFHLDPRFYQTRLFRVLVAALVVLAAWTLHRLRLARLEARFAVVMAERNRMARELHDSLAQGLAGIALHAAALRQTEPKLSETAGRHLETIGRLVQTSLAEARGSVWDLQPASLREAGLPDALGSMLRELTSDTSVKAELEVRGTPQALERQTERNVFRIGQEAVANALKHSQARALEMVLSFEGPQLELRVRDNGRGFDPGAVSAHGGPGFGLTSMRERAAQIGGRVSVNSRPGAGTEVVLEAPLAGGHRPPSRPTAS